MIAAIRSTCARRHRLSCRRVRAGRRALRIRGHHRLAERALGLRRLDGHNLPWKRPNLSAPGTSYNLNNPGAFGRFTGSVGDFSNFGSAQANVQDGIRVEF